MEAAGDQHIFRSEYPAVPVPDNVTLPEFVLQDAELYAEKQVEAADAKLIVTDDVNYEKVRNVALVPRTTID
ncbi:unnamed protein product [Linum tenue]|uniref:PIN domain-containing protein n=1 Tax=Linum tenue TaxID=586396 RepID=A0AAV0KRE4_9ROSI|nr:unnamed protein product [Linum tenue]